MSLVIEPTASLDVALAHASRLLPTQPGMALEQAQEILKVAPMHPHALLILGVASSATGDSPGALTVLDALSRAHPKWPQAHLELGLALERAGRGDAAIAALRRAVALQADLPRAWLALGDHLTAVGDTVAADAAYANHIRYSIRDPRLMTAATALSENRIPEAEALLRAHLMKSPTDVVAIRMLAEIAARLALHEDAEHLLARCLELAPSFHAARQNYALVLHRANKPTEALAEIDTLLQVNPDNASYRNLKAVVLCRIGEYAPAIEIYARILDEYPRHAKIWLSYGHALKTAGHQERSIEAYRQCIAIDAGFGEAWWSLANLKTFRFCANDLAAMQQQLLRPDIDKEQRLQFEFALGKAFEDQADYPRSISHYLNGNELRRSMIPYSADDTSTKVRRSRRIFTREFFAERAGQGCSARDPIFILGLPRSGSTLIEQILASHSQVEGTMELPEIISMTRDLRQQSTSGDGPSYHEVLKNLGGRELRDLGEQYIERTRIHRKTAAPHFIDKMPNNFAHLALIHLVLPNARIIDARRHPLACCFSGFKQHFARGQNFSYSLDDIGRYYRDYVELMAHYDEVLPGRVHRVIYEDLVDNTETQVRRLLDYCGLAFEDGCLRFFENERPVRTASSEQVRKPIYREGVDHWRHFEAWLQPLKGALGPVLDAYPAAPRFDSQLDSP
jgi:tetratricopeptide (TPR) repeat protein